MVVPRKNELKSRQFGGSTCSPMGRRVLVPVVEPDVVLEKGFLSVENAAVPFRGWCKAWGTGGDRWFGHGEGKD